MKKKLLLLALAAALPLSACGETEEPKDEPGQQQGSGDHEETGPTEQEIREAALTESYTAFGELLMDEQTATLMKPYFAQGASVVSSHEVDVAKVYPYLVNIGKSEDAVKVLLEVASMATDGLIDDTVYYFLGFGDGMLKATYAMSGAEDPAALATITAIDTNAEAIATNTIGIIDTVLEVVSDVMMNSSAITGAVEKLEEEGSPIPYKVNAEGLKTAIEAIAAEVEKLMPLKAKLNYLADFVLPVVNMVVDVPNAVNTVFKYVKISDVINTAFDAIGFVVNSLLSLSDDYYTHLAEIQDPIENIAYAILGYVSHAKKLLATNLTTEKVTELFGKYLTAVTNAGADILAALQMASIGSLLKSEKVGILFSKTVNLALDLLKFDLECVSAEKLAAFIPAIVSLIPVTGPSTDGPEIHEVVEKTEGPNAMMVVLGQLIVEVNSILTELASKDEEVTKLLNDVYEVFLAGYDIFKFNDLYLDLGVKRSTAKLVDQIAALIKDHSEDVTAFVLHAIDAVSVAFGAFVPSSATEPAEINLIGLIDMIGSGSFDISSLATIGVKPERLAGLPQLFKDIYTLALDLEMTEDLVNFVGGLFELDDLTKGMIIGADSFANVMQMVIATMFGFQSQGAQD